MSITESEYLSLGRKIIDSENDNYLVELQGLLEWKLHLLQEEKHE